MLKSAEYHSCNPERDYIIACNKRICRMRNTQDLLIFQASLSVENGHNADEKPSVKSILVLLQRCAAALKAGVYAVAA